MSKEVLAKIDEDIEALEAQLSVSQFILVIY
jgi:hypothetical protein